MIYELRGKAVAQNMRPHIGRGGLLTGRIERILDQGIDDLAILERSMRCSLGDEQGPAVGRSAFLPQVPA